MLLLLDDCWGQRSSLSELMLGFDQALLYDSNPQAKDDAVVVFVVVVAVVVVVNVVNADPRFRDAIHRCLEAVEGSLPETRSDETED